MKYLRLFVFIFFCFILTGCSATYNLNIDKELVFDEKLELSFDNETEIKKFNQYDNYYPIDINADDISAFKNKNKDTEYFNLIKSDNIVSYEYKYLDYINIDNDRIVNSCYDYFTVVSNDNNLILSTSSDFKCFDYYDYLSDVTVNITTNKKVYSNNADDVNGNIYTWFINEDNKNDASINMVIDGTISNDVNFFEKNSLIIIIFTFILLLGITFRIFKSRSNHVNKI